MNQRLFQDAGGTTPAIIAGQPVGLIKRLAGSVDAVQATALSKPTLARWPWTGVRNLANGAQAVGDANYWPASRTETGITVTRVDQGIDVDGIPFVICEFNGTAAVSGMRSAYAANTITRFPAVEGDRFTAAVTLSVVSGAEQLGAEDGARLDLAGWVGTTSQQSAITAIVKTATPTPVQVSRTSIASETAVSIQVGLRLTVGATVSGVRVRIKGAQLERGSIKTSLQYNYGPNDITETGVADLWHLYNDGGDSLNVTLPAGTYGLASIDINRAITVTTITSDGTTPINTLRYERQLDVILRAGAFSAGEETAIRDYWGRVFA